jgi:hypothetical protein
LGTGLGGAMSCSGRRLRAWIKLQFLGNSGSTFRKTPYRYQKILWQANRARQQ